jgi:hypothetical protein
MKYKQHIKDELIIFMTLSYYNDKASKCYKRTIHPSNLYLKFQKKTYNIKKISKYIYIDDKGLIIACRNDIFLDVCGRATFFSSLDKDIHISRHLFIEKKWNYYI